MARLLMRKGGRCFPEYGLKCFNNPEMVARSCASVLKRRRSNWAMTGLIQKAGSCATASSTPSPSCRRKWNISESLRNPVFTSFLLGVGKTCDEDWSTSQLSRQARQSRDQERAGRWFHLARRLPQRDADRRALRRLPFAVVDLDPGPNISSVRVDARAGCYAAAKHLIGLGHRRFASPSCEASIRRASIRRAARA